MSRASRKRFLAIVLPFTAAALGVASAHATKAEELYNDGDLALRWDNTIRYSTAFRIGGRDPALLAEPNGDDGDRNFAPGLISNRIDLLSQFDIAKGGFGLDVSAAAWYDTVYNQRNDNNSPATFNPVSVPHDQFTNSARDLHGRHAELVNAFIYGDTELAGKPLSFRLGRHTLLWGESLFFADNGIAAGQSPIDDIKGITRSGSYATDAFLPIAQVSGTLRVRDDIAIEAYYQLEWRPTRLPGAGSYFSADDYLDAGAERYIVGPGRYYYHSFDQPAPASGQYGAALRLRADDVDYGLYALRFNARDALLYYRPGVGVGYDGYGPRVIDPSVVNFAIGQIGTYYRVYPRGIEIYGASAALTLGDSSFAAEISGRRNMPLPSGSLVVWPGQSADADRNALYAIGDTLNADISSVTNLGRNSLWDSATVSADIAANWRIDVTRNPIALDRTVKRLAAAFQTRFEPTYFEVLPHLDLTLKLGVGYDFVGNLSPDPYRGQTEGAGEVDVGITATYFAVWSGTISMTHFMGSPYTQTLADRDFISLSVQRTF